MRNVAEDFSECSGRLFCPFRNIFSFLREEILTSSEDLKEMYYICIYSNINKYIVMETSLRKATSLRLRADLIDTLKERAVASNRSFNNLVESILLNAIYKDGRKHNYPISENIPNEETLEAMNEEVSTEDAIDFSSYESFLKSQGL